MKVFTCKGFSGHWPVGTAAVVVSESAQSAAEVLNDELKKGGLPGDVKPEDLSPVSTQKQKVIVLCDGNY